MTDVEAAEKILAQLSDQKDRASEQAKKISAERQAWAYSAHVDGSEQAKTRLAALNKSMSEMATTIESLDASLLEAKRRLDAARQATNRAEALVHINHIDKSLAALVDCAPQLDVCWGKLVATGFGGQRREIGPKNGPLFNKTGAIVAELVAALKALSLDRGATWPPRLWDVMHVDDLRLLLQSLAEHFGRLPAPRECTFSNLVAVLASGIKAELQTNNREAA
jgi:hypothetical protein